MKRICKLLCSVAIIITISVVMIGKNVKPEAAWLGPSSLQPYQQDSEEMRAVWVATVGNLNVPTQKGTSEAAIRDWQAYYLTILDNAEKYNLNTIIFQIRPANDAFYPSQYNPWSAYLAGYGVDPGWDPLEWMIEVTHARGMEYHAWLNPYRVTTGTLSFDITTPDPSTGISKIYDVDVNELNSYKDSYFAALKAQAPNVDNPIFASGSELHHNVVLGTEDKFILNPAAPNTVQHIENTIGEIVDNYDIDGIHFDDYFYPNDESYAGNIAAYRGYTYSSEPWIDMADYQAYVADGGTLSIYDWRRDNVNNLIKTLSDLIRLKNTTKTTNCAFGISPAARWAPTVEVCSSEPQRGAAGGMSGSCYNYYSYSDLYADTYKWAIEEWIDYIVPQNYTNLDGDYVNIMSWWSNALINSKTKLYVGTAAYQVSSSWGEGALELFYQIRYNQSYDFRVDGYVIFSYSSLLSGVSVNAMNTVRSALWKNAALTPTYEGFTYNKTVQEHATVNQLMMNTDVDAAVTINEVAGAKAYAIYKKAKTDSEFVFDESHFMAMCLGTHDELVFKYDENNDYALVTYEVDNSIFSTYEVLDFSTAIYKQPPVIDNITPIFEEVLIRQTLDISFNISDVDSTDFTYRIILVEGTRENEVATGSSKAGKASFKWTAYSFAATDLKFKIIVNDGTLESEAFTDTFNLVTRYSNQPPVVEVTSNKAETYCEENVELNIVVTDDGTSFTYQIFYAPDGISYTLLDEATTSNPNLQYTWKASSQKNPDGKFKIVVNDGLNETTEYLDIKVTGYLPVLDSISDIPETVAIDTELSFVIKAHDNDQDGLSYLVLYSKDGTNYNVVIGGGDFVNNEATVKFKATDITENGKFKITIEDADGNKIEEYTKSIKVTAANKSGGCGCKKSNMAFNLLMGLSLLVIVLRKREK